MDISVALSTFSIPQPTPSGSKTFITTEGTFTPLPYLPRHDKHDLLAIPMYISVNETYNVWLFVSSFFHTARYSQSSTMFYHISFVLV